MSTNSYLEDAKKTMVEFGIFSEEKADDYEHNVDDACYLLNDLTAFIKDNPEILAAARAVAEEKRNAISEIMKNQTYMIDQHFGYPDLLFFGHNDDTKFSTERVEKGYSVVSVKSESLGLENTRIGVRTDTGSYYANEDVLNELNNRFR